MPIWFIFLLAFYLGVMTGVVWEWVKKPPVGA